MWVSVHLVSGAAAGEAARRAGLPRALVPALGPPLHALLDAAPHWDYTAHRLRPLWSILDGLAVAALLIGGRRRGVPAEVLAAGALSAAPDLDVANEAFRPADSPRRFFPSHRRGFPHGQTGRRRGILIQAGVVAVSLAVLLAGSGTHRRGT